MIHDDGRNDVSGTGDGHRTPTGSPGHSPAVGAQVIEPPKTFMFEIPGRLPGTNEITNSWGSSWQTGYGLKKKTKRMIGMYIMAARVPKFTRPVVIHINYFERDNRRDRDNVQSGAKFILDTLKTMKRIENDNQKWVLGVSSDVLVDKKNPRVEVRIREQC